jgi:hypothetical protein
MIQGQFYKETNSFKLALSNSLIHGQKQHAMNYKDSENLTYQNPGLACDCKSHNAIHPATFARIITICIHNWLYKKLSKFYQNYITNFSSIATTNIMGASFWITYKHPKRTLRRYYERIDI